MSDNYDFSGNIDDILAEFSSYSSNLTGSETRQENAAPVEKLRAEPKAQPEKAKSSPETDFTPAASPALNQETVKFDFNPGPAVRITDFDSELSGFTAPENKSSQPKRAQRGQRPVVKAPAAPVPRPAGNKKENARKSIPPHAGKAAAAQPPGASAASEPRSAGRGTFSILCIIFAVISLFTLAWVTKNVHPDSGTVVSNSDKTKTNLVEKLDNFVNNSASDALGHLTYIPKIYTIAEGDTVAPRPSASGYGSTTDPQEIMGVIEKAAALLDGQELLFDPNANFIPGRPIRYYLDETILAISWQEDIDGRCLSCSEVKVAHGSQVRRKLADDTFNSGKQYLARDMARECNAVVAINGDFYANRSFGIMAYNRELYRFTPKDRLDSCSFTASGDMLFAHAGELADEEYMRQYMEDNDVVFTISFGPILIENGELKDVSGKSYPVGEGENSNSRTGIAQLGPTHYFMMCMNYLPECGYNSTGTISMLAKFMYDKGCTNAYALDGGQTSSLLMGGELVNHVDWGDERLMSDLIYFATAIPEEEAAQ